MSDKKNRPESRQKKSGQDTEERGFRPESRQKKSGQDGEERGLSTEQGRKSSVRRKSSMKVDQLNRVKSSRSSKSMTKTDKRLRKLIGKCRVGKHGDEDVEEEEEEEEVIPKNYKIWDKELEKLALRRKRASLIDREIGLRLIRVLPATPKIENFAVKKRIKKEPSLSALVLRRASSDAELMPPSGHIGPRYDPLGKIIPYSILGDVESFLKHSRQRKRKSDILLVHPSEPSAVKVIPEETCLFKNPIINEENALNVWRSEMAFRNQEQNRLAGILSCKEKDLLMCKSEIKATKELINLQRYADWRYDPKVRFWTLADKCTGRQLHETLGKSARGQLQTPVLSGDADSILQEKGKSSDDETYKRFKDDIVQKHLEATKGTIQIANKVLFDNLVLEGEGIKAIDEAADEDKKARSKGVRFLSERGEEIDEADEDETADIEKAFESGFNNFFGTRRMSKVVRDTRELMKFKGVVAEPGDDFGEYDPSRRRGAVYQDLMISDQMTGRFRDNRGALDFRFIGLEKEEIDGPALLIDGTTLQWDEYSQCEDYGYHGDNIIKEVFVLIKGQAEELIRGFAKLENIGTTTIRYSWLRVPDNKPLPVPRPRRRFFYFLDDEGVVLPRETVYVPMLFKSPIPGYFTESWLLSTQPPIEGGAKVKYTFKAMARYDPHYRKFREIEDYFNTKESQTVCLQQINTILDYAVMKVSLQGCHRNDPVEKNVEEIFMETNPGLYYYAHVIKRIKMLCESFIPKENQRTTENGIFIVSIADLWMAYLALPDDDKEEMNGDCESYTNLTRKQTLLWQLSQDVATMSFRPIAMLHSSFKTKYFVMHSLLQTGLDHVVSFAHSLANRLGLVTRKEVKEPEDTQKQAKGSKNRGKATSRSSRGDKKGISPDQKSAVAGSKVTICATSASNEELVFSAAHKFRTDNSDKDSPMLAKYDEKVYLEVYSMLVNTIEEMSVILEDL